VCAVYVSECRVKEGLRGTLNSREWNTREWKTRHHNAGVENAGVEIAGKGKLWKANILTICC